MSNVRSTEKRSPDVRKAFKLKFFNSKNVFALFLCSTVLFTLLALLILYAQSGTFVKHFDYTNCLSLSPLPGSMNGSSLHYKLHRSDPPSPSNSSAPQSTGSSGASPRRFSSSDSVTVHTCMTTFHLSEDSYDVLYVHYQMNDYYKNFMSFSSSYSNKQVFGHFDSYVLDQCGSQTNRDELYHSDNNTCAIAPCGELPNFMFNDTVRIYYHLNATTKIPIQISSLRLTDSYFDQNFANPDQKAMPIVQRHTKRPRNWRKSLFELDPEDGSNNGFRHQRLIVWMYPNPFSDFSKLYGKITTKFDAQVSRYFGRPPLAQNTTSSPAFGKLFASDQSPYLPKGNYTLEVTYNYPLWSNRSLKRFSISTVGMFGQDNPMFTAFVCLASVISFLSMIIVYLIYQFHDNKYRLYISKLSNADVQF